jgi:hypothetical protein
MLCAARVQRRESRGAAARVLFTAEGEREPAAGRSPTAGQEGRFFFLILA